MFDITLYGYLTLPYMDDRQNFSQPGFDCEQVLQNQEFSGFIALPCVWPWANIFLHLFVLLDFCCMHLTDLSNTLFSSVFSSVLKKLAFFFYQTLKIHET